MKTALIAGATGLIGKQLMYKLIESNAYSKVIILVRKAYEIKHPKLEQIPANYENMDSLLLSAIPDDVFCCLGTTMAKAGSKEAFHKVDYTYVLNLASFFAAKGAKNFLLVSSIGADKTSAVYYSRTKGEIEEAVSKLPYKGIFIFRPSILLGKRDEFRLGERIGIGLALVLQPFMLGSIKKYRPIYGAKVAVGMIKCALQDKEGKFILESDQI
jgi:uncharacterized protein YbjT (DUF2867 family)